jgi:hypothetical protein
MLYSTYGTEEVPCPHCSFRRTAQREAPALLTQAPYPTSRIKPGKHLTGITETSNHLDFDGPFTTPTTSPN